MTMQFYIGNDITTILGPISDEIIDGTPTRKIVDNHNNDNSRDSESDE